MPKPPDSAKKRRGPAYTPKGERAQRPGSIAEKAETEIGDSTVYVNILAAEMRVAVDVLNRLRLAQEAITGDCYLGVITTSRIEGFICDDVQDALLLLSEMAQLPLAFIAKQRALWEDEVARYALALWTATLRNRWDASIKRSKALRLLQEGDKQHVKRTATFAAIADALGLKTRDRERQVRRILFENIKAQGGASNVERRLLRRELRALETLPDAVDAIPPDESIVKTVRASRRKLGIE